MGSSAAPTWADLPASHQLHSRLPNRCQISHSCYLLSSTISPSTISALWSIYIYLYIQACFPHVYPSKGKTSSHHNYTPWEEGCWLTLKFLGSIFSCVACFLPSGFNIPRKASELSRCCTMSLMAVKTLLPWPLTWSDCFISSAESMPLKCVK